MKAQVYSLIALVITIPIMLFIAYYFSSVHVVKRAPFEKVIADQIAEIGKSIDRDFEKAVEISAKRALLAATGWVIKEGAYLDNATLRLEELITNGTIYGNETFIMLNNTLQDWLKKMEESFTEFDIDLSYRNLRVKSGDGFDIVVSVDFEMNISDKQQIFAINKDQEKHITVSVDYIEDPVYPLNTGGYVGRSIERFPYPYHAIKILTGTVIGNCSGNVTFDINDSQAGEKILVTNSSSGVSGFLGVISESGDIPSVSCYMINATDAVNTVKHFVQLSGYHEVYLDNISGGVWSLPIKEAIEHGYYTHFENSSGPDIIGRLEGKLEETVNGIESFVNIPELQYSDIPVKINQVSADYLYFQDKDYIGKHVRGLPEWFRMDDIRAKKYNLTELME